MVLRWICHQYSSSLTLQQPSTLSSSLLFSVFFMSYPYMGFHTNTMLLKLNSSSLFLPHIFCMDPSMSDRHCTMISMNAQLSDFTICHFWMVLDNQLSFSPHKSQSCSGSNHLCIISCLRCFIKPLSFWDCSSSSCPCALSNLCTWFIWELHDFSSTSISHTGHISQGWFSHVWQHVLH